MKVLAYWHDQYHCQQSNMLVALWKHRWGMLGWEPVVLGEWLAVQHKDHKKMVERVASFPTVNDPNYEKHCFYRWLAFDQFMVDTREEGSVWIADIDQLNYTFSPVGQGDYRGIVVATNQAQGRVLGSSLFAPRWFVSGMVRETIRYCVRPWDKAGGRPHMSDTHVARNVFWGQVEDFLGVEKLYGDPGWEVADIVHYSNHVVRGKSRIEAIAERPWQW